MTAAPLWLDLLLTLLVVSGAGFALVGAWGLAHLSDFFKRLHGPTKASTLGVGGVLLASIAWFAWAGAPQLHELLITVFIFMTAPVSAHMLVKAALHLGPRVAVPPPPPAGASQAPRIASAKDPE